jgi:hypothetical protein
MMPKNARNATHETRHAHKHIGDDGERERGRTAAVEEDLTSSRLHVEVVEQTSPERTDRKSLA